MGLAGAIHIRLQHQAGAIGAVHIRSSRPAHLSQTLLGKTPEQLLDTVALLFTLCGHAQAYAALAACRTALGIPADHAADSGHELLVHWETLREQAWRVLLSWPGLVGQPPDQTTLAALLKSAPSIKRHLFGDTEAFKLHSRLAADPAGLDGLLASIATRLDAALFNGRMTEFGQLASEPQLQAWLRQNPGLPAQVLGKIYAQDWMAVGQNPIPCLPDWDAAHCLRLLPQPDLAPFSRWPHWQGGCADASALGRQSQHPLMVVLHSQYGNGLLVRMVGRLLELAGGMGRFRAGAAWQAGGPMLADSACHNGMAVARLQAARGLLIHCLILRQGKVYDYHIIAPTEWNFHPQGLAALSLRQLRAGDQGALALQAEFLLNALDPCVPHTLDWVAA